MKDSVDDLIKAFQSTLPDGAKEDASAQEFCAALSRLARDRYRVLWLERLKAARTAGAADDESPNVPQSAD